MLFMLLALFLFHVFYNFGHCAKDCMHSLKYLETWRVEDKLILAVSLTLLIELCLVLEKRLLLVIVIARLRTRKVIRISI
jgi:hypothetical protein